MLLSLLTKEEKNYFIDLLIDLIEVDGEASDVEISIIKKLKFEMGDDVYKYKKSNIEKEKLIEYFAGKTKSIRNIVYLNLIDALLYDEWYNVNEHIFLEQIQKVFKISEEKRKELMKLVYSERDLREKAKRVISE